MQNKFFGSKLNSVLLLILIVLMVFALRIMLKDKTTYLPVLEQNTPTVQVPTENIPVPTDRINPDDYERYLGKYESEYMDALGRWALSVENNGIPKGWERWSDNSSRVLVQKIGPSKTNPSYIIKYDIDMIKNGAKPQGECSGGEDQPVYCIVGYDPEVLRFWSVVNYFH